MHVLSTAYTFNMKNKHFLQEYTEEEERELTSNWFVWWEAAGALARGRGWHPKLREVVGEVARRSSPWTPAAAAPGRRPTACPPRLLAVTLCPYRRQRPSPSFTVAPPCSAAPDTRITRGSSATSSPWLAWPLP
jgi:hypothetical protein